MGKLDGKTAIVTGASRGIGKQIAVALAREGANLVVASRTVEAHRRLPGTIGDTLAAVEAVGSRGIAVRTDLTVADDIRNLAAEAVAAFGGVDILVNNAADTSGGTPLLVDLDIDDWRRQFEANVTGPLQLMQAVVPAMAERGGGTIVNLTSGAADLVPASARAAAGAETRSVLGGERLAYAASKAALNRLANALVPELAAQGITIVNVDPGYTRTELVDLMAERGVGDPDRAVPMEVPAAAVVHLITSGEAAALRGEVVRAAAFVAERNLPLPPRA